MLSLKKLKLYIFLGGIFISLFFSFALFPPKADAPLAQTFIPPALAIDVLAPSSLSTRPLADSVASIINAFVGLTGTIALVIIVYGGYLWMFSGGDPKKIQNAKKVLISATIGLIIILLSWAIVSFIFNAVGGGDGNNGNNVNPPLPPTVYSFRVDDYSPKGNVPVAVCMPVQARFSLPLDQNTLPPILSTTFHLRLNCTLDATICDSTRANLGTCNVTINAQQYCSTEVPGNMAFATPTVPNFTFRPANDLEKNAAYLVTINDGSTGVKSQSGRECVGLPSDLGECKQWEFTTNDQTDKIPPQVAKVSPADAATNVCRLKSIAAQFNEEMDETTLRTVGAFSIAPADTVFNPSVPSYTVLRENPSSPMTANTPYMPLLNSDIITDACGNFLDGDEDGTAEGSVNGDDYAPPPAGAPEDWSFTTGETIQCVPEITSINPASSFYDDLGAGEDTIVISGENFDDIADTVSFTGNLPVGGGTMSCYNNTFTKTDQICMVDWDGISIPNAITVKIPAGGLDSNGAITGPIKVKIGQFTCDPGQRTCIEGSNKGLVCADNTQCPASSCGSGSCSGGSNAGNGCAADNECPGSESNPETLTIPSPHIQSITPAIGGAGTWITIASRDSNTGFGTGTPTAISTETVELINATGARVGRLNFPCLTSWTDSSIVAEIPEGTPLGIYSIQVTRSDGRHSNLGMFEVTGAAPGPGICAISESCGEAGTVFNIDGKRFGTVGGNIVFRNNNTAVETLVAKNSPDWSDDTIQNVAIPVGLPDAPYSIMARVAGFPDSNPRLFNKPCAGTPCDADTTAPACQPDAGICTALGPTYSCNTTTCMCENNPLPKVVEQSSCLIGTQSPSPYKGQTDSCTNAGIAAKFDKDMDDATVSKANIQVDVCENDDCSIITSPNIDKTPWVLLFGAWDGAKEGFAFQPNSDLLSSTAYRVTLKEAITANGYHLDGNGNGVPDGSPVDDYSWIFKTSNDSCKVKSILTSPANMSIAVGSSKQISAIPQAENCNVLDASSYNWTWDSTIPVVAGVSTDDVMPAAGKKDPQQSVNGVASGSTAITASISTEPLVPAGSSNVTVTAGTGPGICNMDTFQNNGETGVDCGGGGCPACVAGGLGAPCDSDSSTPICNPNDVLCTIAGYACSVAASCTCQPMPIITATDWCKDSGDKVGKNTAITVKFSTLMDSASFKIDTGSGGTVSLKQADAYINGSLGIINNGTNTEVTFYPSAQLGDGLDYVFTIKGGADGVKSKFGIRLDATSSSTFTTGTKLCKIDKVTITLRKDFNPDPVKYDPQNYSGPDLFTCAGKNDCPDDFDPLAQNQHNAIAQSFDANGQELSGITYSWTKSTDAPFTMLASAEKETLVQADPKSGIGALTVKADGGAAGIMSASTNVTVAPCDNPWPPAPNLGATYPFQDNGANPTNFSLWYCRDAGAAGTADDLPALNIISKVGAGEMLKEFFFYDAANPNDALGLRVYQNYDSTISNKQYPWSAREWYEKRAPNKQGAPASTTVDGWEGVAAGRSIYVNAANHLDANKPKTHIYLMSHSDKISANLQNIYGQLKSNWKFAITEYDDGTDGTSLNPPADRGHLRKLQRDTKRLSDLYDAAVDLYQSKISKGKYPPLPSGSYIGGNSTSVWPSWDGELSKEVGAPLPHDPISQMSSLVGWWKMDDGSGDVATNEGPMGTDGDLNGGLDATGWRSGAACKFGSCLEFDAVDDYVDLGSFSGLYSNKLTISAWIKTKKNNHWNDVIAGDCGNFVFAVADGKVRIEDQCGNGGTNAESIMSTKLIDDEKWHHIAVTYDGLVIKIYIDGVFEISGPAQGSYLSSSGNLHIGSTPKNNIEHFDGSIDEVRIWNTPLSDSEINNLFKSNAAKFGSSEDSGWDQTENAFSCQAGADFDTHIYHYQNEPSEKNFSLYAALEWVGGDGSTWRQKDKNNPYTPCATPSSCACYNYRQREVDAANLGLCGNGQWDSSLGEVCDGSVTTGLTGIEGRICATGVCSNDATKSCTDNLQCPGGVCTPGAPTCDASCQPFCPGAAVVKAVCGNGKIESPLENCECSDFNNKATCGTAKGLMSEYYCLKQNDDDDLSDNAITNGEINDRFLDTASCSPVNCNLACADGNPVRAEVNNAIYEPWVEQCEPKRGYCSNSSSSCTQDSDCGGGNYCIALGNGGYYCDNGGAIQCNNGTRGCPTGNTLTSCIGGAVEWNECGGDNLPPKPYNYLDNNQDSAITDLYGWCFR